MDEKNWQDLSRYRFDAAKQCLKSAKVLLENHDLYGSVNRSYYAIYNALRSVIILDGTEMKKHSGTISYFQKEYIKTGVFSKDISDIIMSAFDMRNDSDYGDLVILVKEDVENQIDNAGVLLADVESYLKSKNVL